MKRRTFLGLVEFIVVLGLLSGTMHYGAKYFENKPEVVLWSSPY